MTLLELIHSGSIVAQLKARERNGAIRELVQVLADDGRISAAQVEPIVKSIIARERSRGTTGFGKGAAAPHAKIDGLGQVVAALGRSALGIDFAALDGEPVYCVVLILSPSERPEEHLKAMDLIFRHLQQDNFRKFIRQLDSAEKLLDLLREADAKKLLT